MNSSFSSYFSDDEEDQSPDLFHSQRRKRQQLMHHSAAMRLCRRGSPPFAQASEIRFLFTNLISRLIY
uniref:Uncharacterized protein n=1 Tax=Meloidogyne incognita TaxID=6306 RepID=A0A914MG24_MELIC